MTQLDLLSYRDGGSGWKGEATSREAAAGMDRSGRAAYLREQCLALFQQGLKLTADECAGRLGETPFSIRPRIAGLHKDGLIKPSGERRRNDSGKAATVWEMA